MPTPPEEAVNTFSQSFNCSQSVFSAFASQFGLDRQTALQLASPFGGGMARRGEICGAVTGALLALGLARGASQPAGKDEIYRLSQEFMHRFKANHDSLLCHELLDFDACAPDAWTKVKTAGKSTTLCPLLVRDASEIVQSLLETP
jgi:C_GCAxxG_C_C family probable redox protein